VHPSEIPLNVLAEAAADGVILIDNQSTILFVNPAAGRIFGYEPVEILGNKLTSLMPERLRQIHLTSLERYITAGKRHIPWHDVELTGLHKSGREFPLEVSFTEYRSQGGHFFAGFVRDVTERKQTEEALRVRADERACHAALGAEIHAAFANKTHGDLRSILQASAESVVRHLDAAFARIWTLNKQQNLLELQASAGQYTGLNGEYARILVGEAHIGGIAQDRKPYMANDLVNDRLTEHPEWAEQERIIALAGYPLIVEGHLVGVLAMFARQELGPDTLEALASVADTIAQGAERKQNEEKLVAQQRQWEDAQLLACLGSWSWNISTGALTWSDELYRIFGRDKEAFCPTHQTFSALLHPEDRELFEGVLDDCLKGHRPYDCEIRVVRPDGTLRTLQSRGQAVFDETGKPLCMIGTAQDITERKRAEEALQRANAQLHVLSRRLFQVQEDERRHLARELHDQMGQALTAAKLNLQAAQRLEERSLITRKLDDGIAVLETLLQQTREISLDLRPALLDELGLVPALRWYLDQQAQRAELRAEFFADPALERVDASIETACFRVAQEALTNVVRHARAQTVSVELDRAPEVLHLVVRDDGIGFDVATTQQGASLGVLGMRERVTLLGGELDCKSAPGRGTEVHAFFPLRFRPDGGEPRP
jgi:PAS domain S-box-containing protein